MRETGHPETGATTLGAFLGALEARTPAPAGGGAAGVSAAMGAALLAMVARFSTGERFAEVEPEMHALIEELTELGAQALETVATDAEAFGGVAAAYALAKTTDEERSARSAAIQQAMVGATDSPLALGDLCGRLAVMARILTDKGNANVVSDVGTGAACIAAALDACLVNVAANTAFLRDEDERERLVSAAGALVTHRDAMRALVDEVRGTLASR